MSFLSRWNHTRPVQLLVLENTIHRSPIATNLTRSLGLASRKLGSNAKPSLPRTWSTQEEVALEPNLSFVMGRSWYGLSNKDERLGKSSKKSTPRWLLCETCLVRRERGKYPPSVILGNRWRCNYMEREYPSPKDDRSDNMFLAYLYTF